MLTDEAFDLPTAPAITARKNAQCVLTWCTDNRAKMSVFAYQLMSTLKACFIGHAKVKVRKERMWEKYYQLRSTTNFSENWTTFLNLSGATVSPTLYQHNTNIVFNHLIKEHFTAASEPQQATTSTPTLDYNERNALRYISGYITRKLYGKLKDSKHELKDKLCLCISELNDVEPDELSDESNEWMSKVDRGGLKHVTTITYTMFASAEVELRKLITSPPEFNFTRAKSKIIDSDDVQFYWSMVSSNWVEEVASVLLEMMIDKYVKIRGHSTASAWLEQYKRESKKSVQKSKGVRKQLLSKNTPGSSTNNDPQKTSSED